MYLTDKKIRQPCLQAHCQSPPLAQGCLSSKPPPPSNALKSVSMAQASRLGR